MKLLKHKFDEYVWKTDGYTCIYCGIKWIDIRDGLDDINLYYSLFKDRAYVTDLVDYLNEYSSIKCITDEEFIIKSIIE